jgi:hypothetical protein
MEQCEHYRCVNPWHFRLTPNKGGIYERENSHDLRSPERIAEYKRRVRKNRADRERAYGTGDQGESAHSEGVASD